MVSHSELLRMVTDLKASASEVVDIDPIDRLIAIHNYSILHEAEDMKRVAMKKATRVRDVEKTAVRQTGLYTRIAEKVGWVMMNGSVEDLNKAINYYKNIKASANSVNAACVAPFIHDMEYVRGQLINDTSGTGLRGEELERFVEKNVFLANEAYRGLRQAELDAHRARA